jgi:predicted nuclease of predicted toxin-antitoxin system
VKLLFDQNLSRKLVDQLQHEFPDSIHVTAVGLGTATDRELWQFAREHGFAIVSKDSDFRQLAFLYGPPPKVIWLRVGNASTAGALQVILDHLDDVLAFDETADAALLVVPRLPN